MSDALPPTPPRDVPDAERLRRQADALRRAGQQPLAVASGYSPWQRFLVASLILLCVGVALLLLLFGETRRQILARLGQEWVRLYQSDQQAGIHKLPAPPPRPIETRVVGAPVIIAASEEPLLVPGESTESQADKPFVPPARNPQFEGAFRVLTAESTVAAALVAGEVEGVQFQQWRPLQARPPLYFIDLVATDSSGNEGHYVWSVNLEDNQVTAQSQLARDLETGR